MIPLITEASPVSMSAGVKSSQYTIALTGKTFEILSSMLYKDPHLAIIRELSCNAYDSHVENGCVDKAFDIHLPNQLEPHFTIRDYGIGMSAEQIDSVYTKFFESTKTKSNDVVGALGLGSKSPFSYTSNYTITSWHGGLKLVYSAFKSADGIPSIALLDVSDSIEPSGLEVTFAVKASDFEKFTSKVQSYFTTWGSVPPSITGGLYGHTTLRQVERDFGGTDWFVATVAGPLSTALAIQGNVPYPLQRHTITSSNAFRDRCKLQTARDLVTRLLELPIIITFPIGSLDFSASREELQYTEQTVAVIIDKLLKIGDSIKEHIQAQFAALPTPWDVVKFCKALRNDRMRYIVQLVDAGKLIWKGQTISTTQQSVSVDTALVAASLALHKLQVQTNKRRKMEAYPLVMTTLVGSVPVDRVLPAMSFSPKSDIITVVVFDEVKGCAAKLKHHFLDNVASSSSGDIISIGVPRGDKLTDIPTFKQAVTVLLEAFRIPGSYVKVVFTSDLATPPAKGRRVSQASKPDDTFKVFAPCLRAGNCPTKYSQNSWDVVDEATLDLHIASGKYAHIVFVPQLRGIPQYINTNSTGDVIYSELAEDFSDLWNNVAKAFLPACILLVGIKVSAIGSKKAKAFLPRAQAFDIFLRMWFHNNAKTVSQTDAYHITWVNNSGKQNIVLRAVATIPTPTNATVAATSVLVNKFICDTTAQLRATANKAAISTVLQLMHRIDRLHARSTDSALADIATVVANSGTLAQLEYGNLMKLSKQLEVEFPMLSYVNTHYRYSGNDREIKNTCDQVHKYLKLASA